MKRLVSAALGLVVALTLSCKNKTEAPTAAEPTDRTVAIAVSDDASPGTFKLADPLPDPAYVRPGQRVRWTVINNTKNTEITSIVISDFATTDGTHHDPFEGGPDDQKFRLEKIATSSEKPKTSNRARQLPQGVSMLDYKYKITVTLSTGGSLELDPRIVIGN